MCEMDVTGLAAEDHVARARARRRRGLDDALGPGAGRRRAAGDRRRDPARRELRDPRLQPLDAVRQHRRARARRDRLLHAARADPAAARPRRRRPRCRPSRGTASSRSRPSCGPSAGPTCSRSTSRSSSTRSCTSSARSPSSTAACRSGGRSRRPSLGQALCFALLVVVAQPGVDYGLPGQVAMRATLGLWGARLLSSPYRMVAATYWFAAQALAGALGIQAIVVALGGSEPPLVPVALALGAFHATLAVLGFDVMRWVLRVVLPLSLVFTGRHAGAVRRLGRPALRRRPRLRLARPAAHVARVRHLRP